MKAKVKGKAQAVKEKAQELSNSVKERLEDVLQPKMVTPEGFVMKAAKTENKAVGVGRTANQKKWDEVYKKSDTPGAGKSAEKVSERTDKSEIPRISEVEIEFKRNPKHDKAEFERQLKAQEEGINSLTVEEFIQNRDRYLKEGRALEGNAAQKLARQEALKEKVAELRKQGLSREEATKKAEEWIKEQAALHNPDQIAGGKPDNIGGMGDKRINSSIGSQWKSKIGKLDKQIREIASTMTKEERESTFLNIKLKF
nr:polymorphic toxin type 15 domain-containing protein [Brevibacillus gelatini]